MHSNSFWTCNKEYLFCVGGDHWRCILCSWGITQRKWYPCCSDSTDGPEDDGTVWWSYVSPWRTYQGKADRYCPGSVTESECFLGTQRIVHPSGGCSQGWRRAKSLTSGSEKERTRGYRVAYRTIERAKEAISTLNLHKMAPKAALQKPLFFPRSRTWLQHHTSTATVRKLLCSESCCLHYWLQNKTALTIIWISNVEILHHDPHRMNDVHRIKTSTVVLALGGRRSRNSGFQTSCECIRFTKPQCA